jgi:UDP-N-acetylglucosamine 4,6-dehydratase/5-epimerase
MIKNKRIFIIGGTGALGKTLVKRYYDSNEIIVLSRDEHKHYYLQKEYPKVHSIIGDVKDKSSIKNALLRFKPQVVINAAALKHVPICEDDPFESVKTNIIGHQNVIESVTEVGNTETLIFVSTDKACNPINVYGMCKAISERLYVEYAKQRDTPKVVLVRYGNVLESTGSVIPYFKDLLKKGSKYLPITSFKMTRFLLSLEQATELIDWAYESKYSHGKIAIPKIKSLKIVDIAKALIESHGKSDVKLKEIGVRPGEKLHEELISNEEWSRTEEYTNFLIGNDINDNQNKDSFNSYDSLMDSSDTLNFLKENEVI